MISNRYLDLGQGSRSPCSRLIDHARELVAASTSALAAAMFPWIRSSPGKRPDPLSYCFLRLSHTSMDSAASFR